MDVSKLAAAVAFASRNKEELSEQLAAATDNADMLEFSDLGSDECEAAHTVMVAAQDAFHEAETAWLEAVSAWNAARGGEMLRCLLDDVPINM